MTSVLILVWCALIVVLACDDGFVKCPKDWRCHDNTLDKRCRLQNGQLELLCCRHFVPCGHYLKNDKITECPKDRYEPDSMCTNETDTRCYFTKEACDIDSMYTVSYGTSMSNIVCSCKYTEGFYNPYGELTFSMDRYTARCFWKKCPDGEELKSDTHDECRRCDTGYYKVGEAMKKCELKPESSPDHSGKSSGKITEYQTKGTPNSKYISNGRVDVANHWCMMAGVILLALIRGMSAASVIGC